MDKGREEQLVYNGCSGRGFVVRFSKVSKGFFLQNCILVLEANRCRIQWKMVALSPAVKRQFHTTDQQHRLIRSFRMTGRTNTIIYYDRQHNNAFY